ncbi:MAG: (Fe-S)-binding protein [Immundisolibacterales bacterium]|nr:(Fe-S)-binding protein [Immundisolibacterales bacterium]
MEQSGLMEDASQVPAPRRVGLFVTCLVDLYRPSTGFAAVRLLETAGCEVEVPPGQTCCGQPAFNNGDSATARAIARSIVERFEGFDHVVAPSGSCAGMLRRHLPELFADDAPWRERAERLAARVHELTSFLVDVCGSAAVERLRGAAPPRGVRTATYHDSCSGLRELGVREQPRHLLAAVDGLDLVEMRDAEVCCGFGGTFCVKYPGISGRMVSEKVENIASAGADAVLAGDVGCLLNIAGRLGREGRPVRVFHVAEVLAGMAERGIGEPASGAAGTGAVAGSSRG